MEKRSNQEKSYLLNPCGWTWKEIPIRAGTKWEAKGRHGSKETFDG